MSHAQSIKWRKCLFLGTLELRPKALAEVILKQELSFSNSFGMSQQVYNWKRFWCPRSSQIKLGDRGYLTNPESEYGKYANPELVGLEAIANIPCLVLLEEPGIGKSQELINLKDYTEKNLDSENTILEQDFHSCTRLKEDLFQDEKFIACKNGTHCKKIIQNQLVLVKHPHCVNVFLELALNPRPSLSTLTLKSLNDANYHRPSPRPRTRPNPPSNSI
jgi:hypothetical protein